VPVIQGRCWENAARRSFFSRDNMENFIQFCRRLGVHENLLFESDDLGKSLISMHASQTGAVSVVRLINEILNEIRDPGSTLLLMTANCGKRGD